MVNDISAGRLTTHVLDTASGTPAAALKVELFGLRDGEAMQLIAAFETNRDGRSDQPLLEGTAMAVGAYELRFHVGDYFKARSAASFYAVIPVSFVINDVQAHYHVPLLVAPYGYSTYRGS